MPERGSGLGTVPSTILVLVTVFRARASINIATALQYEATSERLFRISLISRERERENSGS